MAQDQGVALARLSSTSDDLAATKLELDKVQTQLQDVLLVRYQDLDLDPKKDFSTPQLSYTHTHSGQDVFHPPPEGARGREPGTCFGAGSHQKGVQRGV